MKTACNIWILLSMMVLSSCYRTNTDAPIKGKVWVPQYSPKEEINKIVTLDPVTKKTAGKVYAYNQYLFQVEPNRGIHVFELVDKVPQPFSFIQIFGAQEIAISNNVLYSNNYRDLVSLDISNLKNVKLIQRVDSAFDIGSGNVPPESGYFQCVDPTKGIVTGWELVENVAADCRH